MRLNDQISATINALAEVLVCCPEQDPEKTAATFEHVAKVLGGTAAWLSGQAVLLRGRPCEACGGLGNINGEVCMACAGAGRRMP